MLKKKGGGKGKAQTRVILLGWANFAIKPKI
jgi:hypothetical protein